jgi:CheY-like chemotaxis protein
LRICVVDDDPLMLDAFSSAITGLGHHSMPTLNVHMALEVVAHSRVDVILVDILMPEQDGLDLIMALRGVVPKIRIVAMTGGGSIGVNAVLGMARGMGADATLAKPFSPAELETALLGDRPRLV